MSSATERKVIFVAGTAYSGSTVLDMILGNAPSGFSCGEVEAVAHPYRPHHLSPRCGCGDDRCGLWSDLRHGFAQDGQIYPRLFERFPEIRYLVDSSKWLPWIVSQDRVLRERGFDVRHVLIWKTPQEYFASRSKRGSGRGWARDWLDYHRHYLACVRNPVAVQYAEFFANERVLETLCTRLDIPYHAGRADYWKKIHHTVFGNSSAKIHLYQSDSETYRRMETELKSLNGTSVTGSARNQGSALTGETAVPVISARNRQSMDAIIRMLSEQDAGRTDTAGAPGVAPIPARTSLRLGYQWAKRRFQSALLTRRSQAAA